MIWPAFVLASNLIAAEVPRLDPECESARLAIDIAHENPMFDSAAELFGSKAVLIHTLYAEGYSATLPPEHALLITWKDGWGSALYCMGGDWIGPVIDPLKWRKVMEIAGERSAGK